MAASKQSPGDFLWVSELTEAQQAVLEPPYIYNRPLVEADGETVVRPRTG